MVVGNAADVVRRTIVRMMIVRNWFVRKMLVRQMLHVPCMGFEPRVAFGHLPTRKLVLSGVVDAKSETVVVVVVGDGFGDLPARTGRCWRETCQNALLKKTLAIKCFIELGPQGFFLSQMLLKT